MPWRRSYLLSLLLLSCGGDRLAYQDPDAVGPDGTHDCWLVSSYKKTADNCGGYGPEKLERGEPVGGDCRVRERAIRACRGVLLLDCVVEEEDIETGDGLSVDTGWGEFEFDFDDFWRSGDGKLMCAVDYLLD